MGCGELRSTEEGSIRIVPVKRPPQSLVVDIFAIVNGRGIVVVKKLK
jgi:hypothetical protein